MTRSFLLLLMSVPACAQAPGPRRAAGPPVRPGIEVLLTDSVHLVRGRRVGILTNQTGIDRAGRSDVDLLRDSGINLTAIFSPEHGFRGNLDQENIGNSIDSATGVTIYSLYGSVRVPTPAMLSAIDLLLIDLQDIGGRPYTYISTTLTAMQAAQKEGRRVIILDRPDPIGGELVQGPVLDSAFSSNVGMLPVPERHGLTLGELARFGNERLKIGADLVVVPAAGWRRSQWFDQTGLPWVRPSPNMPDLESATHYPGLVWFERVNMSVGRGTPIAFQVLGAPWLDAKRMLAVIGEVPGVSLSDTTIKPVAPTDNRYPDRAIPAVRFRVTDRNQYDPTRLAARLLGALLSLHRDSLVFQKEGFDQRVGTDRLRLGIERGETAQAIWAGWEGSLDEFKAVRRPYLLYP